MIRSSALLVLSATLCSTGMAQQPAVKKVPAPYTLPTSGEKVYQAYCASCHGPKGLGDGPVAASLKVATPDLTTLSRHSQGQFPSAHVSEIIRGEATSRVHGTADMPVWGPIFRTIDGRSEGATHIRIYNLVEYLKTMQTK
jgi:mono/diheme cytochrome c family protein